MKIVECRGVVKRFGATTALVGMDADFHSGITGLLGANGAGKTTLITLMLGLRQADGGRLSVLGDDPARAGLEVRQRLGFAPEQRLLPPDMTAFDLVAHMAAMHGLPMRQATQRASDTLWEVGLGEERFRPTGEMSTGQLQRVKLAQATAHHPELLILDEPTDGLDPVQRIDMLEVIKRLSDEHGINILVSSHHLAEVQRICRSVVILNEGQVVRSGMVEEMLKSSGHYLVEVNAGAEELASLLRGSGFSADVSPGGTMVRVSLFRSGEEEQPPAEEEAVQRRCVDSIRDALVSLDLELMSMMPEELSLEQIFEEDYRQTDPARARVGDPITGAAS